MSTGKKKNPGGGGGVPTQKSTLFSFGFSKGNGGAGGSMPQDATPLASSSSHHVGAQVNISAKKEPMDHQEVEWVDASPRMNNKMESGLNTGLSKRAKVIVSDGEEEHEMDDVRRIMTTAATATTTSTVTPKRQRPLQVSESSSSDVSSSDSSSSDEDEDDVILCRQPPKRKTTTTTTTTTPPPPKKQATPASKSKVTATTTTTTTSTPSSPDVDDDNNNDSSSSPSLALRFGQHEHHSFKFLHQERKDKAGRVPSDRGYDETTLLIPKDFFKSGAGSKQAKVSDAQQVWWTFYSTNFDCILAFKVGKFYEMYNSCADVAVRVCGLQYMKGNQAHCGFPEKMWSKFSLQLVEAGYRVARIEQTETPEQQELRTGKKNGQLRRELCSILSRGTLMLTERDGQPVDGSRRHLMAVTCVEAHIGVCILDATTGRFRVGEFEKDPHLVHLASALALEEPAELVYCPAQLPADVLKTLKQEVLAMHTTMSEDRASKFINVQDMLGDATTSALTLIQSLSSASKSSLNLCLLVLQRALIADELVSLGRFEPYQPQVATTAAATTTTTTPPHASLDATALRHLEILSGSSLNGDATVKGSLLAYLDRTLTTFGSRNMREWVSKPLRRSQEIYHRLNAVTVLLNLIKEGHSAITNFTGALKKCPDLERYMSRIHSIGSAKRAKSHPDARAVIYEAAELNMAKIKLLADALDALKSMSTATEALAKACGNTPPMMLQHCFDALRDPSLQTCIRNMDHSFDSAAASKQGVIEPKPGVSAEYDEAVAAVKSAQKAIDEHLIAAGKTIKAEVKYFGSGKHAYQIECKDTVNVPVHWNFTSQRKGFKRYTFGALGTSVEELNAAQASLAAASLDVSRAVFAKFDSCRETWTMAVSCIRDLDCLLSLAKVARDGTEEEPMCVPDLIDSKEDTQPFLRLVRSRHPCVARVLEESGKSSFIPNDITLGHGGEGHVLLLSGPNMGGKSTLLRQTCVAVLMAQIGSYVPAAECHMSLVDRVFTRLGASDRIMHGESTFFVELSEAAEVLNHATKDSLVILDELGRGTSTFDGTAIAHAVVEELVHRQCRVIFASHYHELIREMGKNGKTSGVSLGHMVCLADGGHGSSNNNSDEEGDRTITFLFKLAPGSSDKSYGLNVAKLAKLPSDVIERANQVSSLFESAFSRFVREQLLMEMQDAVLNKDRVVIEKVVARSKALFF